MIDCHKKMDVNPHTSGVDLIWNHTRICGWACKDCCVAANNVRGRTLLSSDFGQAVNLKVEDGESSFSAAQQFLRRSGTELSLEEKYAIIDNLKGFDVRLDFSGGDALVVPDGMPLLRRCSEVFGKNNVSLTSTGAGISRSLIDQVAIIIGEFNFTFNYTGSGESVIREKGYANSNLLLAKRMKAAGVAVRAEIPLTTEILGEEQIREIYTRLTDANVDKLLIMRQFPVGRGANLEQIVPDRQEYSRAIVAFRHLEIELQGPRVSLQCALKYLDFILGNTPKPILNPCDLGRKSFGIMADGSLLASPWAVGPTGNPLDETWVLGNLARKSLKEILLSEKAQKILREKDKNFGHCKIFAGLYSNIENVEDRKFEKADPLYN